MSKIERAKENSSLEKYSSTTSDGNERSHRDSIFEATAKYYTPHTEYLSTPHSRFHHFARRIVPKNGNSSRRRVNANDLRHF